MKEREKEIEFVDWVSYDDYRDPNYRQDEDLTQEDHQRLSWLVIEQIKDDRKKCTGEDHQTKFGCAPMFSIDGKNYVFTATMRYWGELMSQAWNSIEKARKYSYIDFYM